jgi:TalC/MipB family fructose-6-phosphate aldolase
MEFLFDSANLQDLEKYSKIFPITGVTSNPSILKAEGEVDLFEHMRSVRKIIGMERTLHIQVVAEGAQGIVEEAHTILKNVDDKVYIKIPVTEEGLKAMHVLKAEGIGITATAIYTMIQGFMSIATGADFIALYCNRMANLDIDFRHTTSVFRKMIDGNGSKSKILAASFHSMEQVNDALLSGAHAVTVQPSLLHSAQVSSSRLLTVFTRTGSRFTERSASAT